MSFLIELTVGHSFAVNMNRLTDNPSFWSFIRHTVIPFNCCSLLHLRVHSTCKVSKFLVSKYLRSFKLFDCQTKDWNQGLPKHSKRRIVFVLRTIRRKLLDFYISNRGIVIVSRLKKWRLQDWSKKEERGFTFRNRSWSNSASCYISTAARGGSFSCRGWRSGSKRRKKVY